MKRPAEPKILPTLCKHLFTVSAPVLFACTAAADARVKVVPPEMRTFVEALSVQGTVRAKSSAAVSARVSGAIDELCVEEGASVATGTSGELPAGMLDKLGKFLAEDPFGAAEKIDKFCTYLENNGPAALHVADGKNVDLNRLFREVVG